MRLLSWAGVVCVLATQRIICNAEHVGLAELAVESLLLRYVRDVVFPAVALRFARHDAALHQLFCELAAGEHYVLLRSSSMELQAAVRVELRLLWNAMLCLANVRWASYETCAVCRNATATP